MSNSPSTVAALCQGACSDTALEPECQVLDARSSATSDLATMLGDADADSFKSWTPDPETKAMIVAKSSRLARVAPFTPSDRDDLFQVLLQAWFQNHLRHDLTRGPIWAFRKAILDHAASNLLRDARATKRCCQQLVSIEIADTSRGSCQRFDPHRDRRLLPRKSHLAQQEQWELRTDVAQVIQILPPIEARLCEELKHSTLAEISRRTGVPQSTLSSRLSAVRRTFERHRLERYL